MADQEIVGPWKRIKILGYGGFGQVTLWYKRETEEYIALKRPQENVLPGNIEDKQMERWCKEVEMMKKLNHLNIVRALCVPAELQCLSKLPMLAMEYCGLGDLRQVLNKPENCCGLSEPTVLRILRDVSNGLSYLHACKVIHRDLKPDNIVLQCKESVVIYKLIDLGYAKKLDQGNVCKSFVGTVQYLAPELFSGKLYSCSVDYWSFGILAHEVITGYRPFLPGSNPPEWMKQVQNKPRHIISVVENLDGDIIYSSTISKVNHMSRCILKDIEKWLELALDWDGEKRGKDLATNKLVFFDVLNEILNKRTLKIFSLPTYELLHYEIQPDTDIFSLKSWLEKDTGIVSDEQILLLHNAKCMDTSGNVMNFLNKETISPGAVSIFLYNCGPVKIRSRVVLKPLYVKELLEDPKKLLHYKHLKRTCSDSVFFIQSELCLFECLLESIKVKISNMISKERSVESLLEDVCEEWTQVEGFAQFLIISHKADLENYIELRKEGAIQSCDLVQKWIHKVTDVEKKLSELASKANKKKMKLSVEETKEKCRSLEESEFLKTNGLTVLNDLLSESHGIWESVHKIPKESRNGVRTNIDTVKLLYRTIEYTTKMLRSPLLDLLFLQLSDAEEHLTKLVSPLTIWLKSTKIMKQIIENTQKERQKDIWNFVVKQKAQTVEKVKNEKPEHQQKIEENDNEEGSSAFSPFHIPRTVKSNLQSPVDDVIRPEFRIMGPVSLSHKTHAQFPGADIQYTSLYSLSSDSIINTNNYLRYRVQEMSQSWNHLIKEMKSLNWDSLKE